MREADEDAIWRIILEVCGLIVTSIVILVVMGLAK